MKYKGRRQSKNIEDRRGWARATTNPTPLRPSDRFTSPRGPGVHTNFMLDGNHKTAPKRGSRKSRVGGPSTRTIKRRGR